MDHVKHAICVTVSVTVMCALVAAHVVHLLSRSRFPRETELSLVESLRTNMSSNWVPMLYGAILGGAAGFIMSVFTCGVWLLLERIGW